MYPRLSYYDTEAQTKRYLHQLVWVLNWSNRCLPVSCIRIWKLKKGAYIGWCGYPLAGSIYPRLSYGLIPSSSNKKSTNIGWSGYSPGRVEVCLSLVWWHGSSNKTLTSVGAGTSLSLSRYTQVSRMVAWKLKLIGTYISSSGYSNEFDDVSTSLIWWHESSNKTVTSMGMGTPMTWSMYPRLLHWGKEAQTKTLTSVEVSTSIIIWWLGRGIPIFRIYSAMKAQTKTLTSVGMGTPMTWSMFSRLLHWGKEAQTKTLTSVGVGTPVTGSMYPRLSYGDLWAQTKRNLHQLVWVLHWPGRCIPQSHVSLL